MKREKFPLDLNHRPPKPPPEINHSLSLRGRGNPKRITSHHSTRSTSNSGQRPTTSDDTPDLEALQKPTEEKGHSWEGDMELSKASNRRSSLGGHSPKGQYKKTKHMQPLHLPSITPLCIIFFSEIVEVLGIRQQNQHLCLINTCLRSFAYGRRHI